MNLKLVDIGKHLDGLPSFLIELFYFRCGYFIVKIFSYRDFVVGGTGRCLC
jgi:hypothetical protein